MGRIPKEVIEKWKKVKHVLVPTIEKDQRAAASIKKDLVKKVNALFDQFDAGLSKSLKQADGAKSEKDATLALGTAIKTTNDYLAKTKTATAEWGVAGTSVGKVILKALNDVKAACEAATVELAK